MHAVAELLQAGIFPSQSMSELGCHDDSTTTMREIMKDNDLKHLIIAGVLQHFKICVLWTMDAIAIRMSCVARGSDHPPRRCLN